MNNIIKEMKEKVIELEKLIKALDNLSCSSGKYHLVSQAISEIEKEKENEKIEKTEKTKYLFR